MSAALANGDGHGPFESKGIAHTLIPVLGFITISCLITTFILGRLMPKNRQKFFPWHKIMATITIIFAVAHASIVIFFHD